MKEIIIAHTADIHVRPHAYMDEMEFTFEKFIESILANKADYVVIAGDFFHSKLTVSSEYFLVAHKFFKNLSDIMPVIIIPGNHDCALTNQSKLDAITPVVESISDPKNPIIYSKKSEMFEFGGMNFYHFSIFDKKEDWAEKPTDNSAINVVLYHGAINNCIVDNGWVSRGNKDDIDIFKNFDFAMLGDIHKAQFLSEDKRVAYPGSLRQNNFGEDIDKGYLLWKIRGKNDFEVDRVVLPQKRYFFTLHLTSISDLQDLEDFPKGSRFKVKTLKPLDLAEEIKIKEEIIEKCQPEGDILIIPPDEEFANQSVKVGNLDIIHENIRDEQVQKELIEEFLSKKDVSKEKIEKVIQLDKLYHSSIDSDVLRDVIYEIKSLKFDNFLSYGKNNEVNFEKLNGIVGIFGPTGAGKSTIIDSIFFLLHNGIYREGANKNGDYINRKCKRADLNMQISMLGTMYSIERTIKKSFTKGKEEAKVENEVGFYKLPKTKDSSLNGETTPDTNKIIRDLFGSKEDLELTSLASQFGLTAFIDSRGTKRKENFAKFFDLGVFDKKFELALNDHKDIKRKLKDCNKDSLLKESQLYNSEVSTLTSEKESLSKNLEMYQEILNDLDREIIVFTKNLVPVEKFSMTEAQYISEINRMKSTIEKNENWESFTKEILKKAEERMKNVLLPAQREYQNKSRDLVMLKKQASLISTIPNEVVCRSCPLAKSAYDAEEKSKTTEDSLKLFDDILVEFDQVSQYIELSKDIQSKKKILMELCEKYESFLKSKEKIENNKIVQSKIDELMEEKKKCQIEISNINKKLMDCVSKISSNQTRLQIIEDKINLEKDLSEKDEIYSLYMDAMSKNGISYWIISKKMNMINRLVNQILSQAISSKFLIEENEEEKSIKMFLADKKGKRPIEMCSGGEKSIVSIALRAALWKICLLPKTPMLILDESFAFLDSEIRDSAIKLLNFLKKEYFKQIFLITHDEELKRVVDTSIIVSNKEGFSFVEVK